MSARCRSPVWSNIWVGAGLLRPAQVTLALPLVCERAGIEVVRAAVRKIRPDGDRDAQRPKAWGSRSSMHRESATASTPPAAS